MISFKANSPAPESKAVSERPLTAHHKLLITGVENSLANFLAHGLYELGKPVTVQAVNGESIVAAARNFPVIEYSLSDERFAEALARLEPDVIIHAPAEPSREPSAHWPMAAYNRIVEKTLMLCEAARRHSPRSRVVLLSSADVYGECHSPASEQTAPNPVSIQGRYMHMAEQVLKDYSEIHGLSATVLRLGPVYGPAVVNNPVHDMVFTLLGPQGTNSTVGVKPSATRDVIHAADLVQAVSLILGKTKEGTFNVGTGNSVPLLELYSQLCAILELKPGSLPASTIPEASRQQLDVSKLTALGFSPRVSLLEGMRGYAAWWSGSKAA